MTAPPSWLRAALWVQGVYYVVTGALPMVSIKLFQLITGPKTDLWLVRMVGLLAVTIGVVVILALRARRTTQEILWLAALSAASFASIDIFYVVIDRISKVYLCDALVEIVLLALVIVGYFRAYASGARRAY